MSDVTTVLQEGLQSERVDNVPGLWTGRVEDVDDPEGINRIRVRIFAFHGPIDEVPTEGLPWAEISHFGGGGPDYGSGGLLYPTGSVVWVMFEQGKTEFPVVVGGRQGILKRDAESGNPHEFLTVGGKEESSTEKTWSPDDGHEMPHDIFDGPASESTTHPTRTVWSKSFRGHTIVVEDKPEGEFLKIIDRAGQIIEMSCPVTESDNENNAQQRGVKDSIKGDQLDLGKMVENKATIRILDLSGQEILLHAEKDKERIVFTSQQKGGSKKHIVTLDTDKKEIILDQDGTIIRVTDGIVHVGSSGTSDADDDATVESLVQGEFQKVSDTLATDLSEHNKHTHLLTQFVLPLLPIAAAPCIPGGPDSPPPTIPSTFIYTKAATKSGNVKVQK